MKIVAASAYREGAISAIAQCSSRKGSLQTFYTTVDAQWAEPLCKLLPVLGPKLRREFSRRSVKGVSRNQLRTAATGADLFNILVRRAIPGRNNSRATRLMYWVKDRFDVGVALDIRRTEQDAFIGMWGSSLRSFRAAGNNCIKVLNYVNSRPRYHNLYLRQYACLEDNHPEMIPEPTAGRVEEEMALADLLLVPSTFIALQMPEYREKVVIAPYGVDITHFAPRPGHGNQTFNVLYLGQISHRKGLKTLLSAARLLPSLTFRLAGPLVSRELIASLPPNACYIGPVHPAETPELMRCADVFVLPSFEDAYPLVTMEAMASGVPPIVSSNCGTAELLADGKAGSVFRVADADDLARHIQRLFDYPEVRRKAGQEARDRVVSAHTWEQYAERVLSMIDSTSKQLTTLPMPGSSTPDPTIRVGSNRDAGESSDPAMRN